MSGKAGKLTQWRSVPCSACGAKVGEYCRSHKGKGKPQLTCCHVARHIAAAGVTDFEAAPPPPIQSPNAKATRKKVGYSVPFLSGEAVASILMYLEDHPDLDSVKESGQGIEVTATRVNNGDLQVYVHKK